MCEAPVHWLKYTTSISEKLFIKIGNNKTHTWSTVQNLLFLDLGLQGFLLFFKETLLLRQSDILERKECGPKQFQVFLKFVLPATCFIFRKKNFFSMQVFSFKAELKLRS